VAPDRPLKHKDRTSRGIGFATLAQSMDDRTYLYNYKYLILWDKYRHLHKFLWKLWWWLLWWLYHMAYKCNTSLGMLLPLLLLLHVNARKMISFYRLYHTRVPTARPPLPLSQPPLPHSVKMNLSVPHWKDCAIVRQRGCVRRCEQHAQ
jgi:hypothetical protein